ncbi:DUF4188 domain-containing protein [Quadrisphaera sp. KR29]|uniref:DUF4188 domain-containing protein n=1 Tax=Quadrisphaera sp. KR29 TaxID=3461391 RepID=UPI0040449D90
MALLRGRWTHEHEGGLAVFLIGMTINQPWRPDRWLPVLRAMPPMLEELERNPEWGYLGHRGGVTARGPLLVQYWESAEKVYEYASASSAQHRPAWTAFNRRARSADGAVGIWHETYTVEPGAAESICVDSPPAGIFAATRAVPVVGATHSARQRMGRGRPAA